MVAEWLVILWFSRTRDLKATDFIREHGYSKEIRSLFKFPFFLLGENMAREICRLCGRKVVNNRSAHLRGCHGVDTFKGAVREYYLKPEELGIPVQEFESVPEGTKVWNPQTDKLFI